MDKEAFMSLVVKSLEAIEKQYRVPYENKPYERIICYEFYHQFRKRMNEKLNSFVLHGELDKRYRDIKKIPDFVFHIPGTDIRNFAIMEFKSIRSGIRWIKYDLKKLEEFRNRLRYQISILVIFGKRDELNSIQMKIEPLNQMGNIDILFYDLNNGKVYCTSK